MVCIICPEHGEFFQRIDVHKRGSGCPKCCSSGALLNTKEFIIRANKRHAYKYDYSKSIYINTITPLVITCPEHGDFIKLPKHHLQGRACVECGKNKKSFDSFVESANITHHNKYTYFKDKFFGCTVSTKIQCPIHGIFEQIPSEHLRGSGCKECQYDAKRTAPEQFILSANTIHQYAYDYSMMRYLNNHTKISIICPLHGEFKQTPSNHLAGNGCPTCVGSNGERIINKYLRNRGVIFNPQHVYEHLLGVNGGLLRFDFYLPEFNTCIEYDGKQHFVHIPTFQTVAEYETLKQHDILKTEYCLKHNIELVRIRYDENILEKLESNYENRWHK